MAKRFLFIFGFIFITTPSYADEAFIRTFVNNGLNDIYGASPFEIGDVAVTEPSGYYIEPIHFLALHSDQTFKIRYRERLMPVGGSGLYYYRCEILEGTWEIKNDVLYLANVGEGIKKSYTYKGKVRDYLAIKYYATLGRYSPSKEVDMPLSIIRWNKKSADYEMDPANCQTRDYTGTVE